MTGVCLGWEMTIPLRAVSSGDVVHPLTADIFVLESGYSCSGFECSREQRQLWKFRIFLQILLLKTIENTLGYRGHIGQYNSTYNKCIR